MQETVSNGSRAMMPKRVIRDSVGYVVAVALLVTIVGCVTVELADPWERYYDFDMGVGKDDILAHFNLHRGRWWNYYARGSLYLASGHYEEAREDFEEAIRRRSRDSRDARTYGMHFIDYFPQRELGITHYFLGQRRLDPGKKEEQFSKAIARLEDSLRQEGSARAAFYANRARQALWATKAQKDKVPPTIYVEKPIYTNRRTVRFDVVARDGQSHVRDLLVTKSVGDVHIHRPYLLSELAKEEITQTVELTMGSRERMAVVAITASDLAENISEPNQALVILDTEAPTAAMTILGEARRLNGHVRLAIEARDDFGLREIQVGSNPSRSVSCGGALKYADELTGRITAGKLPVTISDMAGNRVHTYLSVNEDSGQTALSHDPRPDSLWEHSLAGFASSQNRSSSLAYLSRMSRRLIWGVAPFDGGYGAHVASLAYLSSASASDNTSGKQLIDWEEWVRPPKADEAEDTPETIKETSEAFFVLQGQVRNASEVDRIMVDGDQVPWTRPSERFTTQILKREIDLCDIRVGDQKDISVTVYRRNECLEDTVSVVRSNDVRQEADTNYGILLLPLQKGGLFTRPSPSDWDDPWLRRADRIIRQGLNALPMSAAFTETPRECLEGNSTTEDRGRFRIYDVGDVYVEFSQIQAWYESSKSEMDVVSELREWREAGNGKTHPDGVDPSRIDLVLYGGLETHDVNDRGVVKREFEIWLKAADVASGSYLAFPAGTEYTPEGRDPVLRGESKPILAEAYWSGLDEAGNLLVGKVLDEFPRLQADIKNVSRRPDEGIFGIERGARHRLFEGMKLRFYSRDADENPKYEMIGDGEISALDFSQSWVRPEDWNVRFRIDRGDIIVTK